MGTIWNFLAFHWWWFLPSIALTVAVLVLWFAVGIFGWQRVRPFVLPIAGLIGLLFFGNKLRAEGYAKREQQEDAAADAAKKDFDEIHKADEGLTDADLDKKNKPWTRG